MPKKSSKVSTKSNAVPNKSEFIRSHGNLKPAELVAKGKEVGLDFKIEYVYAVRQAQKKSKSKSKSKVSLKAAPHHAARAPGKKAAHAPSNGSHVHQHEAALRRAVLDLGITGVRSLLQVIEHKFLSV